MKNESRFLIVRFNISSLSDRIICVVMTLKDPSCSGASCNWKQNSKADYRTLSFNRSVPGAFNTGFISQKWKAE